MMTCNDRSQSISFQGRSPDCDPDTTYSAWNHEIDILWLPCRQAALDAPRHHRAGRHISEQVVVFKNAELLVV